MIYVVFMFFFSFLVSKGCWYHKWEYGDKTKWSATGGPAACTHGSLLEEFAGELKSVVYLCSALYD